jgi:type II secretory pathway component PulJ
MLARGFAVIAAVVAAVLSALLVLALWDAWQARRRPR